MKAPENNNREREKLAVLAGRRRRMQNEGRVTLNMLTINPQLRVTWGEQWALTGWTHPRSPDISWRDATLRYHQLRFHQRWNWAQHLNMAIKVLVEAAASMAQTWPRGLDSHRRRPVVYYHVITTAGIKIHFKWWSNVVWLSVYFRMEIKEWISWKSWRNTHNKVVVV